MASEPSGEIQSTDDPQPTINWAIPVWSHDLLFADAALDVTISSQALTTENFGAIAGIADIMVRLDVVVHA
jgi:hypothetical protein